MGNGQRGPIDMVECDSGLIALISESLSDLIVLAHRVALKTE